MEITKRGKQIFQILKYYYRVKIIKVIIVYLRRTGEYIIIARHQRKPIASRKQRYKVTAHSQREPVLVPRQKTTQTSGSDTRVVVL